MNLTFKLKTTISPSSCPRNIKNNSTRALSTRYLRRCTSPEQPSPKCSNWKQSISQTWRRFSIKTWHDTHTIVNFTDNISLLSPQLQVPYSPFVDGRIVCLPSHLFVANINWNSRDERVNCKTAESRQIITHTKIIQRPESEKLCFEEALLLCFRVELVSVEMTAAKKEKEIAASIW